MGDKNVIITEEEKKELMREVKEEMAVRDGVGVRQLKRKLIKIAIIAAAVIIVAVVIFVQASRINKMNTRIDELLNTPAVAESVTPQISLDVISTEIKGIGELATVEYLYTNAAKFEDSKQIKEWNIPLTQKRFIIKYDGIIKAGVDVNEITLEIDETHKVLTVNMPKAKILSHETDTESVELLDEKNGLFNSVSIEDKIGFDEEVGDEMEERAVENGLLTKAQENAEQIIKNLITNIPGIEEYRIDFIIIEE